MMIPSSIRAKGAATAVSIGVLAVGLVMGVQSAPVEMAGGGEAAPSQLGSSFADLAAGTETSDPPDTVQPADPVAPTTPEAAEPVEPTPPDPAPQAQPTQAQPTQAQPTEAQPTKTQPAETAQAQPTPQPMATAPVQTADPTLPAMPEVTTAEAPDPATPVQATRPEPSEPTEPTEPPETITGEALPPGVVASSRRPPTRTDAFEAEHRRPDPPPQQTQTREPSPTRQAQAQPAAPQQGNADRTERAGSQRDTGGNASSAAGQRQASQAGNAAASNYPGEVMRRVSRVPRPSVRSAGSAVVSFSVAGSGGLASVGIARSSGSAALDGAAVQLIRRAAPFPAPPPGAQRNFSITIAGR